MSDGLCQDPADLCVGPVQPFRICVTPRIDMAKNAAIQIPDPLWIG